MATFRCDWPNAWPWQRLPHRGNSIGICSVILSRVLRELWDQPSAQPRRPWPTIALQWQMVVATYGSRSCHIYYASLPWRRKGRGLSRRGRTSRTACIGGRIAVISESCTNALLWLSEPCTNALLWRSGWLSRRLINELALGIGCILAAARGVHIANAIGIGIAAVSKRRSKTSPGV